MNPEALINTCSENTGHALVASSVLSPGSHLVTIPFDLAITPSAVRGLLPPASVADLPNHAVICLYLVLLDLQLQKLSSLPEWRHLEYARTLPRPEQMQTALWFNEEEFDLLRGSNLYPAVKERRREWEVEYNSFKPRHLAAVQMDKQLFTWQRYLWACTIISTRAFPSYLLDGDRENATQVLLPGIDVFNHRRGAAVTWYSDHAANQMQLLLDETVEAGNEVFNNYGAKPNDELLLGYGFVLPDNPEDFVSLKMGTSADDSRPSDILEAAGLSPKKAHYVQRDITELPGEILAQLRVLVADDEELDTLHRKHKDLSPLPDSQTERRNGIGSQPESARWKQTLSFISWPNELEMLESLGAMLQAKSEGMEDALKRTQSAAHAQTRPNKRAKPNTDEAANGKVREHIRAMIEVYLAGQVEIFHVMLKWHKELFESTVQKAKEAGFEVDESEEDESDVSDAA